MVLSDPGPPKGGLTVDYGALLADLDKAISRVGDPPDVARVRAALILLDGVMDDTLADVVAGDRDHLSDVLSRVDDFTL